MKAKAAQALAEALLEVDVRAPRLVAKAVERYVANGGDLKAACADLAEDAEAVETIQICRAVANGQWPKAARALKATGADQADAVLRAVMGYMRAVLLGGESGARPAAELIAELAGICYLGEVEKHAALAACLYRGCRRFADVRRR